MGEGFENRLKEFDKKILKESKQEKDLIPTCPKCHSTNITMTQTPAKVYFRELKSYYCRDCGYEGSPMLKRR